MILGGVGASPSSSDEMVTVRIPSGWSPFSELVGRGGLSSSDELTSQRLAPGLLGALGVSSGKREDRGAPGVLIRAGDPISRLYRANRS